MRVPWIACALCAVLWTGGLSAGVVTVPARPSSRIDGHGLVHDPHPLALFSNGASSVAVDGGIRVTANVTELSVSGQWVRVTFSGVTDPRLDDTVALFAPGDANPSATAPVKYKWAITSPGYLSSGRGSVDFRVLNLHQDVRFALLRNGLERPTLVARSAVIRARADAPLRGHLSLTGREGEMAVQWNTGHGAAARGTVRWGTSPGRHSHSAPSRTSTYTRADMCGPPASTVGWVDPGTLHYAVMTGLAPATRYYYVYGTGAEAGGGSDGTWSREASFVTAPGRGGATGAAGPPGSGATPSSPSSSVTLLALADVGVADVDASFATTAMGASLATMSALSQELDAQLVVINGDVSYAQGYGASWAAFWDGWGPLFSRAPLMTTTGNHERDWPHTGDRFPEQYDSGGECGVAYYRQTQMPTTAEDKPWYSFDFGPIHFLQYSTEHAFESGSEQHDFIVADLAAVDRKRTPWVIVGGHRPIYIDSTFVEPQPDGDQFVAVQLRDALEDVFYKYKVDVTWHGHHHSYQRTCPIIHGHCLNQTDSGAADAPIHLVIGHGGARLTPNIAYDTPPEFVSVQLRHGYVRVTANDTHLVHTVVASLDRSVMDELILTHGPDWNPKPRMGHGPRRAAGRWAPSRLVAHS